MQNHLQGFHLSPQQRRLRPMQQNNPAFRAQLALWLEGALDAAALRRSLESVVNRHEILRTTFPEVDGVTVQAVADDVTAAWETFDLGGVEPGGRAAEVERHFAEALRVPFDLASGPVVRASLLRLDDAEHVLVLALPALCADSRTLQNLTAELARAYAVIRRGEQATAEATQYADFAEWQNGLLGDDDARAGQKFWREKCAEGFPPLALPLERTPPAGAPFRPDALSLEIDSRLVSALDSLARERGLAPESFLLACWQGLLWHLTGQPSVAVGYACDGRRYEDLRDALGLFARWLPVVCPLDGGRRFAEVWRRAEDESREASDWQEYFTWEAAGVADGAPLPLAAGFRYEECAAAVESGGLKFSALRQYDCAEQFKVSLSCVRRGDDLTAELKFRPDVLDRQDAERLARRFHTLLQNALDAPDAPLRQLSVLPREERDELLHAFDAPHGEEGGSDAHPLRDDSSRNDASRAPSPLASLSSPSTSPEARTLHELFERQAAAAPEAAALTFEGETLSYRELDERADRLARRLVARGVGPDTLVGLLLERSPEMVVALLGVLKAGGAYVPLDPEYPAPRLSFMVADAGAAVIVTQPHLSGRLAGASAARVVLLAEGGEVDGDGVGRHDAGGSDERPRVEVSPDNLAYVIYTSGSTGRPKGVGVTHSNVTRLFAATRQWFDFKESDVWTLFHSYAFDFSVWELWGALLFGGRVVVVPYLVSRSPEEFYALLERERVSVLNQTPSAFRQLMRVEAGGGGAGLALRYVIFGGEALESRSLRPWFERHGEERPRLVNMYGITETTVHVTYEPVGVESVGAGHGGSPIGRPIPDLRVYVLDEWMELAPIGVAGEMYVGGAGLARGYLRRPALTAERFIPDPFSAEPGARLYRTGDVGRYVGGRLEYVGRADQQVKVRGFRIELGEIEAALSSHAGVREAVVSARDDDEGQRRLVAYFVAAEGSDVTAGELRQHLSGRLPDYMLPAALVRLDALPLTPNGKVDKRALPEPGGERPELAEGYEPPAGADEEALAEVWSEVLGVGRVGASDNFFALGGDSIRSVRLVALAKERGLSLSVEDVFRHQTVRELAGALAPGGRRLAESAGAVRTEPFDLVTEEVRRRLPADVEDAYPLTLLQAGMLYHIQLTPDADAAPYHNVTTWHLRAPFDDAALGEAVRRVVARHAVLRTSFDFTSYGEPLQLVHREAPLHVAVEDLRGLPADEQEALISSFVGEENRRPFDFARPPLLRLRVHRRTDDTFQFTITEHHAIFDGWSLTSTLTEIFTLYLALAGGESPAEEPPAAVSFRDFVKLERMAIESEECARYWAGKLSDADVLRLPRRPARPREAGAAADTPKLNVPLPDDVSEGLRELARAVSAPLKSVLLAAHLKVLSVVSGQGDVLTGVSVNGRPEDVDGERVRGLFLNTVPLRVGTGGGTWADLVRRTFEAERELLPFRRYPMALLQNQYGRQGLFEVLFGYLHFHSYERLLRRADSFEVLSGRDLSKTNFPLNVIFHVNPLDPSRLSLTLQYDGRELAAEQIEQFSAYYLRVLSEMARAPFAPHEDAPLLAPEELERQLVHWNATRTGHPLRPTIQESFEGQAARTPDAVAVTHGGEGLTYAQLNRRANQLARRLRGLGVTSDVPVGVLLERSLEMVVALLGVLKAGGCYVPLDPSYPPDRLAFMLDDAQAPVLLTQSALAEKLSGYRGHAVRLDADRDALARASDANLTGAAGAENLAYIIYTSGSTGVPKGVAVPHRAVHNLVVETNYVQLDDSDVVAQVSNSSFDAATFEIWGALLNGARLVIIDKDLTLSPADFAAQLRAHGATVMFLTTALFNHMAGAIPSAFRPLRVLLFGGEASDPERVAEVLEKGSPERLLHVYGPTETTTFATWFEVESIAERTRSVPIGRPLTNVQAYVLDERLRPLAIGASGELYLGGDGLARGYLKRPALTAERFVPHPYATEPGARLYRTGDLVRYLPDGAVEFIGRADQQVKLRGFRVELGEIEAALVAHPSVREAVVLARAEASGDRRLVGYVVADGGADEAALFEELRRALRASLPEYMTPSAFVRLDALPLTPNGKVDKRALPEPDRDRPELLQDFVAPRDENEERMAAIWAEVMQVERVGVHDNFFELGGHSLLATQIISRAREVFAAEIPVRRLFETPTVAGLSAAVAACKAQPASAETSSLRAIPRRGRSIEDQLAELDVLSREEVEALLGAEGEAAEGRREDGGGPR